MEFQPQSLNIDPGHNPLPPLESTERRSYYQIWCIVVGVFWALLCIWVLNNFSTLGTFTSCRTCTHYGPFHMVIVNRFSTFTWVTFPVLKLVYIALTWFQTRAENPLCSRIWHRFRVVMGSGSVAGPFLLLPLLLSCDVLQPYKLTKAAHKHVLHILTCYNCPSCWWSLWCEAW